MVESIEDLRREFQKRQDYELRLLEKVLGVSIHEIIYPIETVETVKQNEGC